MTATHENPGSSRSFNFDLYLITAYFANQYYKDAMPRVRLTGVAFMEASARMGAVLSELARESP